MKIVTIMLFVFVLGAHSMGLAQHKMNVNFKEITYENLFQEIRVQTGFVVMYNSDVLNKNTRVAADFGEIELQDLLNRVLSANGFTFKLDGEFVIVTVKEDDKKDEKKSRTIKGMITDEKKLPLPGVTIMLKGTSVGTVSNVKGEFSLDVPSSIDTLIVSFVGMKTQYIALTKDKSEYSIVMKEEATQLGEIVVTGYQEFDKTRMAGSVSSIKAEDLYFSGTNTLEQALQGRLPGLVIMNQSGLVGVRQKVRVRGTSTLLGSQEPIWVVDGIIQEDPLPFDTQTFNNLGDINSDNFDYIRNFVGSSIAWLNPNDIESITVLKDASSTAIYGVRAANGVIVIKTKRGKAGKPSVSYSVNLNLTEQVTYDKLELMNSKERVAVSKEIFQRGLNANWTNNKIGYAGALSRYLNKELTKAEFEAEVARLETVNTDWFDILFRMPFSHSHSVSVSGGSEDVRYYTSFRYGTNIGTAIGNDSENYGANVGVDMNWGERIRSSFTLSAAYSTTNGFYQVSPYEYATKTNRAIAAFEDNGELAFYQQANGYLFNIINERNETGNTNKSLSVNTNLNLNFDISRELKLQLLGSVNISSVIGESWATERTAYIAEKRWYDYGTVKPTDAAYKNSPLPVGGEYNQTEAKTLSWNWRASLSYDRVFNDVHALTTMLGVEFSSTKNTGFESTTYGYLRDRGKSFAQVPLQRNTGYSMIANELLNDFTHKITDRLTNKMGAYLTLNYAYDGRYVVNFSVRTDASNRFGRYANENFNPVWAGGLRWNVAREVWFSRQNIVSDLSFRFSFGYQRNMASNYSPSLIVKIPTGAASQVTDVHTGESLLQISSLPYEDLRWEKTYSYNYGVDLSLFNHKIQVGIEYYLKKGKDIITALELPREYGQENMPVNGGSMKNSGFDLSVNFTPVRTSNFTWTVGMNTSKNTNEVTKVGFQNLSWRTAASGSYTKAGYPVSAFWAFDCDGIDQETGYPIINLETHGDGDPASDPTTYMEYAGKLDPDFTGGLNMSFRYKQFSLNTNLYLQLGGKKFLADAYGASVADAKTLPSEYENLSSELNGRWRPGDTDAQFPGLPDKNVDNFKLPDGKTSENEYTMYNKSNARVVNASSLKCNNLSLSYFLPEKVAKRLYCKSVSMSASMSNLFTIASKDFKGRDPEVAMGQQPLTSSFSFGLSVTF